jgi:hypothetical protein
MLCSGSKWKENKRITRGLISSKVPDDEFKFNVYLTICAGMNLDANEGLECVRLGTRNKSPNKGDKSGYQNKLKKK